MVVPVNTNVQETQNIAEEYRQQRPQIFECIAMRNLHLQHHDRDNYRDHSVAKCLQASRRHRRLLTKELTRNLTRTGLLREKFILCSGSPNWSRLCDLRARSRTLTTRLSTSLHRVAVVFSAL